MGEGEKEGVVREKVYVSLTGREGEVLGGDEVRGSSGRSGSMVVFEGTGRRNGVNCNIKKKRMRTLKRTRRQRDQEVNG